MLVKDQLPPGDCYFQILHVAICCAQSDNNSATAAGVRAVTTVHALIIRFFDFKGSALWGGGLLSVSIEQLGLRLMSVQ